MSPPFPGSGSCWVTPSTEPGGCIGLPAQQASSPGAAAPQSQLDPAVGGLDRPLVLAGDHRRGAVVGLFAWVGEPNPLALAGSSLDPKTCVDSPCCRRDSGAQRWPPSRHWRCSGEPLARSRSVFGGSRSLPRWKGTALAASCPCHRPTLISWSCVSSAAGAHPARYKRFTYAAPRGCLSARVASCSPSRWIFKPALVGLLFSGAIPANGCRRPVPSMTAPAHCGNCWAVCYRVW